MQLEERKIKEIEHSDRRRSIVRAYEYQTDADLSYIEKQFIEKEGEFDEHFSNMKFYSITKSSFEYRDALLYDGIKGTEALDYCCGNGEIAIEMAKRGAKRVVGIDISPVAIENATELAQKVGVGDVCEFKVMDAEHTEFQNETFDVIHEYGALHHLDLSAAFKELSRILKPDGKLICTEALRHNPFIHLYRKKTPHLRTQWEFEHILGIPEIKSGKNYFADVNLRTFHLAELIAVPFRRMPLFKPLLKTLNMIDDIILNIPLIQWWAWVAVAQYNNPIK